MDHSGNPSLRSGKAKPCLRRGFGSDPPHPTHHLRDPLSPSLCLPWLDGNPRHQSSGNARFNQLLNEIIGLRPQSPKKTQLKGLNASGRAGKSGTTNNFCLGQQDKCGFTGEMDSGKADEWSVPALEALLGREGDLEQMDLGEDSAEKFQLS